MEKKDLKFYEAPAVELVGMESECHLLAGSGKIGGGGKWHAREDLDFEEEDEE